MNKKLQTSGARGQAAWHVNIWALVILAVASLSGATSVNQITGCTADVVFVLDESTSITKTNFTAQLNFVNAFIDRFDIEAGTLHVGVVGFSDRVQTYMTLGESTDISKMKGRISAINQSYGQTMTHLALGHVRRVMFSSRYARPGVPHIAIMVTDGDPDYRGRTTKAAAKLRSTGATIIALGVGDKVNTAVLEAIASPGMVLQIRKYHALVGYIRTLAKKTCRAMTTTTTSTTTTQTTTSTTPTTTTRTLTIQTTTTPTTTTQTTPTPTTTTQTTTTPTTTTATTTTQSTTTTTTPTMTTLTTTTATPTTQATTLPTTAIPTTPTTTTAPPVTPPQVFPGCTSSASLDVAFALSDTAGVVDTAYSLVFVNSMTTDFALGPTRVQVALTPRFCVRADGIDLDEYDTTSQFNQTLYTKRYLHTAPTGLHLINLVDETFTAERGARDGAIKVAIILVDNPANSALTPLVAAADRMGVHVLVVGVGDRVSDTELQVLATSSTDVFRVGQYSDIGMLQTPIYNRLCTIAGA